MDANYYTTSPTSSASSCPTLPASSFVQRPVAHTVTLETNQQTMVSSRKEQWPPSSDDVSFREISDMLYGSIPLYYPLNLIVDTPEFQRMRRIKQLGATWFVYPNCEHSRFVHCLGVYHLARIFAKKLAERVELHITSQDQLCVAVAGLCHDLGHGPFSHVFDGPFLYTVRPESSWTHEEGSVLIFRRIVAYPWIRKALLNYIDEEDFIFIEELINPSPNCFNKYGEWTRKGRGCNKSFLYDIISNVNDSLDVDKYDYLLRDSLHAGVAIPLNHNSVQRIMDLAKPLEVDDESRDFCYGYSRICYAYKVLDELDSVGQSRYRLHDLLYNHHTVRACEEILVSAFQAAAPYLKFLGDDGKEYRLDEVVDNIGAFLKTDDGIFQMISNSSAPELEGARHYIECLERRWLPKFVAKAALRNALSYGVESIKDGILRCSSGQAFSRDDLIVNTRKLHRGMGISKHPMSAVLLYNHKGMGQEMGPYSIDKLWLEKNPCETGGALSINVYIPYDVFKTRSRIAVEVLKAFTAFVKETGLVMPRLSQGDYDYQGHNDSGIVMET